MGFYLSRYTRALRVNKRWALLALLPPALYLMLAVFNDLTFKVSRDFSPYSGDTPVAGSNSPVNTLKLEELVAKPDLLFLDEFTVARLQKRFGRGDNSGPLGDDAALRNLAHSTLSLVDLGDARLRLSYRGKDPLLGGSLVGFYTDRLLMRIKDGMLRTAPRTAPGPLALRSVSNIAVGEIVVVGERSMWDAERLRPALIILAASGLGVLVLIAVFELTDPSFKSERQMAQYLGVPVLGALPNAEPLVRALPD
ncbi:hypothetical protein [uncultured Thiodictyon sp.]|uniref:hypothetical protein n=1 Tax=uncultured Thiodictyon sp. TaxID=1846217 RepID=UPI0025ED4E36|nr:hypothetical protein [uncultured Thiodictyon sp.]